MTGSDASHVTRSDVSHLTRRDLTGSDVIFRRFFPTIVVVQNVPLREKLEDTEGIIRSRKSNDKEHRPKDAKGIIRSRKSNDNPQWDTLYYYYSKKKARENEVTYCHVTNVTSGHVTNVISGHVTDVASGDVTSGNTHFPNYYDLQVLKTVKY